MVLALVSDFQKVIDVVAVAVIFRNDYPKCLGFISHNHHQVAKVSAPNRAVISPTVPVDGRGWKKYINVHYQAARISMIKYFL